MPKASPSGRGGAIAEARELICLVSALRAAGDVLDAQAVQKRLGRSPEHAEKLLRILAWCSAGDLRIPLAETEEGYQLVSAAGLHGAPLALTPAEESALDAARAAIRAGDEELLLTCAKAINLRRYLVFGYRKAAGGELESRCVAPARLYRDHGNWLLEAHDCARDSARTFRLDRMRGARAASEPSDSPLPREGTARARAVELFFADASWLEFFDWPGLELDESPGQAGDGPLRGTIPYYGTDWLVRQICACGGGVRTSDRELRELVRSYAKKQLNGAE